MSTGTNPAVAIEPEDYRRLVGFKLLLLAILGVAAYLNSVYGTFLFEDEQTLARAASGSTRLSPTVVADWSFALNEAVSADKPWSYHAFNIALNALAALALYGVVCRTLIRQNVRPRLQEAAPWLAFLIALLWLAHPLNTETVDYLSRRGDLLAGLFYFVTLYCVIRGAQGERGPLWYGLAVLACLLGMGSALTMVTAPLVVLLYDRIYLADSWRDLWRRRAGLYAGFVACWALWAASVFLTGYDPQSVGFAVPGVSPLAYTLAQPGAILHDLGLVFWPMGICFDYFDWPLAQTAGAYVVPFVVVGALLLATVWALLRRPKVGFLGAWFFLTLAPTSSFIPRAEAAGDYRMYLPLAAVAVLVVLAGFALVQGAGERAPWAAYTAAVLALLTVGALGFTTLRRNTDYESALKIWEDTAAKRPDNVRAHAVLGNLYLQRGNVLLRSNDAGGAKGDFDRAAAESRAALDAPDVERNAAYRAAARSTLEVALLAGNHPDETLRLVADAPEGAAERAKRLNDFGFILWTNEKPAEAATFFAEAVRLRPETAKYHFNLALALLDKGDKNGAAVERTKGLDLDADWPKTARELAWKKATDADPQQRNPLQAIFLARQACQDEGEKRPESLDALAAANAAIGRFKEAEAKAEQALQLAEAERNETLTRAIRQRLALYKDQKPFVQQRAEP